MALIQCPECNNKISNEAKICPHCGYQIPKKDKSQKIEKIKYISSMALIFGIIILVFGMSWVFSTADERLSIKSGYYFGTAVTESEWIEYQKFVDLQGFVCNTGLFLFITAIIVKIVLYVKFKRK